MSKLTFHNPVDISAYKEWEFEVLGSTITLRTQDLLDEYVRYLDDKARFVTGFPSRYSSADEEYRSLKKLVLKLKSAIADQMDLVFEHYEYLWSFSSHIVFERRFVSIRCPACQTEYLPENCTVHDWSYGKDLAAEGGRRVLCPKGHTLYAISEWNS